MASIALSSPRNVEGDFFVDTTCIDCDLCRQIAPGVFADAGGQSVVWRQPAGGAEELAALKALVTCPTASIGARGAHSAREAASAFPEPVQDEVHFCGYASADSYGASSYLLVRPEGNVLVDSPRFARPLLRRIEALGGVRTMFLTHRDDVAEHEKWAQHFGAERVMHAGDARGLGALERLLHGEAPVALAGDLLAIPTPGHTRGHTVLLYRGRFLFSGDHLWRSQSEPRLSASRGVCWYSWSEQTRSMQRLLDYGFEWVLPGHGRRFHAPEAQMRAALEECIARMKRSA
jgi:glyoxylase-like metal-dependent hydrolase (beta-lactamase superfamily II)/ferredoxin